MCLTNCWLLFSSIIIVILHRLYYLHMLSVGQTTILQVLQGFDSQYGSHNVQCTFSASKVYWIACSFLLWHVLIESTNFCTHQVWQSLLSQCNTTWLVLKWSQSWIHLSVKHFRNTLQSWVMEFQNQAGLLHNFIPETWFLEIWDEKLNSKQLLLQPGLVNFCQQLKTKS